jgi:hypothetical protein
MKDLSGLPEGTIGSVPKESGKQRMDFTLDY